MRQLKFVNVKAFKNNKIGIKKEVTIKDKVAFMQVTELVAFDNYMRPVLSCNCSTKYLGVDDGKYAYYDIDKVTYVGLLQYEINKSTFQVNYNSVELAIGMLDGFDAEKNRILVRCLKNINHSAYSKVFEYILSESLAQCRALNI